MNETIEKIIESPITKSFASAKTSGAWAETIILWIFVVAAIIIALAIVVFVVLFLYAGIEVKREDAKRRWEYEDYKHKEKLDRQKELDRQKMYTGRGS